MAENDHEAALAGVDAAKRKTLRRLITGTVFVTPVVATFAMDGLTISRLHAQCVSNCTTSVNLSDRRLKTAIQSLAQLPSGLSLYRFKYLWSDVEYVGVMAQEVREQVPAAAVEGADGFLRVDYGMLGLEMVTYAAWCERNASSRQAIAA